MLLQSIATRSRPTCLQTAKFTETLARCQHTQSTRPSLPGYLRRSRSRPLWRLSQRNQSFRPKSKLLLTTRLLRTKSTQRFSWTLISKKQYPRSCKSLIATQHTETTLSSPLSRRRDLLCNRTCQHKDQSAESWVRYPLTDTRGLQS